MGKQWVIYNKKANVSEQGKKYHINPWIMQIIRNRDVIGQEAVEEYLFGNLGKLENPFLMKDMEKGVNYILDAIKNQVPIRIISDYDVDGIMSNYILYHGLKSMGADVDYEIPDRKKDGYGLNQNLIKEAKNAGRKLILTCDNGIAAFEEIAYANELGIAVIVTDHHEVPFLEEEGIKKEVIPDGVAVIDSKQKKCRYPFKELCGAGVAYQFLAALENVSKITLSLTQYLPYVAIATVCDVVSLTGENRILVKEGMKELMHHQDAGLSALMTVSGIDYKNLKSYHFGFVIGPCLNAGGRLETAKRGLRLLLEENPKEALKQAQELVDLNQERKSMTNLAVEQGKQIAKEKKYEEDTVLVIYLPECHESIAGIVAGRLRECYYKPVFVITKGEVGAKGSGRSIPEYSMFEKMNECADLFTKFGGHPMAAGFSLAIEDIEELRKRLNACSGLKQKDLTEKIKIDLAIPVSDIKEDLINELDVLEPFGKDNEKPVFAVKDITLQTARVYGSKNNVLQLGFLGEHNRYIKGVYFGDWEEFMKEVKEKHEEEYKLLMKGKKCNISTSILYYPTINEYNGIRNVQLKLLGIK